MVEIGSPQLAIALSKVQQLTGVKETTTASLTRYLLQLLQLHILLKTNTGNNDHYLLNSFISPLCSSFSQQKYLGT